MVFRCWQIIIFAALFATSCERSLTKKSEKRNIDIELFDGCIAFRNGMGAATHAVLLANKRGSFSHVGVVLNIDGEWFVIHEVPYEGSSRSEDHISAELVGEFFNVAKASSGAIYKHTKIDSTQREAIRSYALRQLDKNLPFDHDYNLADTTSQYCSEFVWRSYLEAGIDLSEDRRTRVSLPGFIGTHIMPADIEQNLSLELIYNF